MTKTGKHPTAEELELIRKEAQKPEPFKRGQVTACGKLVHAIALRHGLPAIDGLYVLDQDGEFARPT